MHKIFSRLALAAAMTLSVVAALPASASTFIISGILTWAPGTVVESLSGPNKVLSFSFNATSPGAPILNTFAASINGVPVGANLTAAAFTPTGFNLSFPTFNLTFLSGIDWSVSFPPTPFTVAGVSSQVNAAGPVAAAQVSVLSVDTPPVPEPATWALMLGGFAAAGGFMRTRPRSKTVSWSY